MADEPNPNATQIPPEAAQPPAPPPAQQQAAPPQPPAPPPALPVVGEDGDIPEGADTFTMTKAALRARNDRHAKKYLRDTFGTDDPEQVKAKLAAAAEYEKAQEEQRRQALTREQQLQEDLEKARALATNWQTKYQQEIRGQAIRQSDSVVQEIGGKHLKPKFLNAGVYRELGTHLVNKHGEKGLKKLEASGAIKGEIDAWFAGYARENPELTPSYEASLRGGAPPPPPPARQPLNNGAVITEQPPPANASTTPSFSPSGPNALSPQAAAAEAAKLGISWQ